MAELTQMKGFGFSEDHQMYQAAVRKFIAKEIAPEAKRRNKRELASIQEIRAILKKLYDSGLFGMELPEQFGGQASDWTTYAIAIEELAKVDFLTSYVLGERIKNLCHVAEARKEIRDEWLLPCVKGEKIICFCMTEPGCGSDAAAMRMRASRDGNYFVLNGEKTAISFGNQADLGAVFAKTDPHAGIKGISRFIMPLDLPGISRSRYTSLGFKQIGHASLFFDDVRIPSEYLVGEENSGFVAGMKDVDTARLFVAIRSIALAQVSLEKAIAYAKERIAFGRPIIRFEAISFKLAEHLTLVEAGRLLCYKAFWLADQGLGCTKEAAMAKWFSCKLATDAIHDALIIHGHAGYSEEYSIEEHLRDAVGLEIADAPAEIQKMIIAREVFGKEFRPG